MGRPGPDEDRGFAAFRAHGDLASSSDDEPAASGASTSQRFLVFFTHRDIQETSSYAGDPSVIPWRR